MRPTERVPRAASSISSRVFAAILVAATLLVYANTFSVPFLFDDIASITQNASIRRLSSALSPPADLSVTGRPLVNLTLAINYAWSGENPRSYHAVNLAIHAFAALTLFGVMRRTLMLPQISDQRIRDAATPLAFFIALLWAVHPLQTATVTYIMQRTESLMALCYLLTFYAFLRSVASFAAGETNASKNATKRKSPNPTEPATTTLSARRRWSVVAVMACFAGMASKEVMVSAPGVILLFDRTFIAGSFRRAWEERRFFYSALATSWLLLAWLLLGTAGRGASAGFGTMSWSAYALTQLFAIAHYLRLAVWPHPLVFDYGAGLVTGVSQLLLPGLVIASLTAGTVIAVRRRPLLGFLGCFFFAVIAPSSSVVPIATQTIAEHRLYLPLAPITTALVVGAFTWLGRRGIFLLGTISIVFGVLTLTRNRDYRSVRALWADTVAKRPENPRAHYNLGVALGIDGDHAGAATEFEAAVHLEPRHAEAHLELGGLLLKTGNASAALTHFESAARSEPGRAAIHSGLARALVALGRLPEALPHFADAARLDATSGISHLNLGNALLAAGRPAEALGQLEHAQTLQPNSAEVFFLQGNALVELHRLPEAVARYQAVVRLEPERQPAHYNLGNALAELGRYEEALTHFEAAAKLDPADASARNNRDRLRAYLKK